MLILRRKAGESIVIGEDIHLTVLDINEGSVRLAIDAPKAVSILRSELLQAADTNRDSASAEHMPSHGLLRFLGDKNNAHHPRAVRPGARTHKPTSAVESAPVAPEFPDVPST